MTKETKQDVFEDMVLRYTMYLENVIYENGNQHSSDKEAQHDADKFRARYAAASPGKLPVIPKEVGEVIRREKPHQHEDSGNTLEEVFAIVDEWTCALGLSRENTEWINQNPDTFALAWLLGDWEVEDE